MQKQIIFIHGGDSFDSYEEYFGQLKNSNPSIDWFAYRKKWIDNLHRKLSGEYQIFAPHMPNKQNANYEEWKIWFEKMIPFINDQVILIGHSQGGIFLAKYLSENIYPRKIKAVILVAPPHTETLGIGSFKLEKPLKNVFEQCQDINLFQSTDDPVVPANEAQLYKKDLPEIKLHIFEDKQHFNQESFPELMKLLKDID